MEDKIVIPQTRDTYWDSLKFVLIFLVVFAHYIKLGLDEPIKLFFHNFIFCFHMPLFIIVSGFFTRPSTAKKTWKGVMSFVEVTAMCTIYVYLIWGNAYYIVPWYVLWYLVSLVCWRLIVHYLPMNKIQPWVAISVATILCLLVGVLPINGKLAIDKTIAFFPFFLIGYYLQSANGKELIKKLRGFPQWISALSLIIMAVGIMLLNKDLTYYVVYAGYKGNLLYEILIRLACIATAIVMSVAVINLTPDVKLFAKWGKATLYIFIYHAFITYGLWKIALRLEIDFNSINVLLYLAMSVATVALIIWFSKYKLADIILHPISYLTEIYKTKKND